MRSDTHLTGMEGGVIAGGRFGRPVRDGRGREAVRTAVRAGAFFVDPWGPSRARRWLHVQGARLAVARPPSGAVYSRGVEVPTLRTVSLPGEIAPPDPAETAFGEMAGGGAA